MSNFNIYTSAETWNVCLISTWCGEISKAENKNEHINPGPNFLLSNLNYGACFFRKKQAERWLCLHKRDGWTRKEKVFDPSFIMMSLLLISALPFNIASRLELASLRHAGRIWVSEGSVSRIISWFVQNMEGRVFFFLSCEAGYVR